METHPRYLQQASHLVRPSPSLYRRESLSLTIAGRFKANHARYIRPDTVLHPLYFSCVRPEWRRQGLVGNLVHHALEVASDHHFDTIVCESSALHTSLACEQLGFKEVASVEYRSFLYEGEKDRKSVV